MEKTTEKIPTWSLCYLINDDASGLTDEEIQSIDRWQKELGVQIVSPCMDVMVQCWFMAFSILFTVKYVFSKRIFSIFAI